MWTILGLIVTGIGTYLLGGDPSNPMNEPEPEPEPKWYEEPIVIVGFVFIGLLTIITVLSIAFRKG